MTQPADNNAAFRNKLMQSCRMPDEALRERYYAAGYWRAHTIIDSFLENVQKHRKRAALVVYRKGDTLPQTLTYAQLGAMVDRMAMAFIHHGLQRDDVVSIQMPNGWRFAVAALAAARAGAIVNPMVTIFRRREMEFMLNRAESRFLVVQDHFRGFDHGALGMELQGVTPSLSKVIVARTTDAAVPEGALDFDSAFLGSEWDRVPDRERILAERRRGSDEIASLMYTSGTTGEPKGTLHTYNTLWSASRNVYDTLSLNENDVGFMASPMGHLTGYLWGLLRPLSMGMTAVFQETWDPAAFLDVVEQEGITWTVSATPFVVDSVNEQQRHPRKVGSFKYFVCAGAPVPPTLSRQAADVLGIKLLAMWGTSECGGVTIHRPEDSVETVAASDGRKLDYLDLAMVDADNRPVPQGQEARLLVRGPSVFVGYLGRRDLYDAVVDQDRWFDTGDLGTQQPDGGVRITGRVKDIIIRGGENIPVVEIENVLYTHPMVRQVVVVGIPDHRLGERACAVVVPKDEAPTLQQLTAYLAEKGMAKQYWPEKLVVRTELPHTPSGKVQKFILRDELRTATLD